MIFNEGVLDGFGVSSREGGEILAILFTGVWVTSFSPWDTSINAFVCGRFLQGRTSSANARLSLLEDNREPFRVISCHNSNPIEDCSKVTTRDVRSDI